MSTVNFQRKAVTTAVAGVLAAGFSGVALAADVTPAGSVSADPTLSGASFVPGNGLDFVVNLGALTAPQTDDITYQVTYLNSGVVPVSASATDAFAGGPADIVSNATITAADGGASTLAIITVEAVGDVFNDGVNGPSLAAYVKKDGTIVSGYATHGAAITAAAGEPDAQFDVNSGYTGIKVVSGFRDTATGTGLVISEFNADVANVGANSDNVSEVLDVAFSNIPGSVDSSSGTTVNIVPVAPATEFPADPEFVRTTSDVAFTVTDTAGNSAVSGSAALVTLTPADYAGAGESSVAVSGSPDDLYGDAGVAALTVHVRLDQSVDDATFLADGFDDLEISGDGGILVDNEETGGAAVINDADGNPTILQVGVVAGGTDLFFADPDTGNILHGADRESAVPVTAQVRGNDPDGIALLISANTILTTDRASVNVMVAEVQDPTLTTQDNNQDGWIDGGILDFQQDLASIASDEMNLASYLDDADGKRVVLEDSFSNVADSSVLLVLSNPDTPQEDGTAPEGNANNDYNADGNEDEDDAALVIEENFNTGVVSTLNGGPGAPFAALVGTYDDDDVLGTTLTYARAYDPITGEQLAVNEGVVEFSLDGASPVVQSVTYFETHDEDDSAADGYDRSGTVVIKASEDVQAIPEIADAINDSINEYLFDGVPSDLVNLAAFIEGKISIGIGVDGGPEPDEISLTNLPRTLLGNVLSLGVTGGAEDSAGNPLFIADGAVDASTVEEGAPAGPAIEAVKFMNVTIGDEEQWHLGVQFDQPIAEPDGQVAADRNALFTVRALVGWDHDDQSSSDGGTDTTLFQFIIPGVNTVVGGLAGAASDGWVTLLIPGGGLPGDTTKVWADYQGATDDEIADGSLKYLQNTEEEPTPAKIDGDGESQFDDDDAGQGTNVPLADTQDGDAGALPLYGPTVADEDTGIGEGTEAPYFNGGEGAQDQRNLFTQTIGGKVEKDGEAYPDGTGIRVDVVRIYESSGYSTVERKASVGNGYIDIRQASNSEFIKDCDCDLDDWVTYALLNKAVTGEDFDKYAKDVKAKDDAYEKWQSSEALNKDEKTIQKDKDAYDTAVHKLETKWLWDGVSGKLPVYVEVTHGDGGKAPDGTESDRANEAQANGNASYGRTASLNKNLPNTKKNGTSYYPAYVNMADGTVSDTYSGADPSNGNANIDAGHLDFVATELASSASSTTHYEVLDTAYAQVKDGEYRATVGVDEEALDKNSKGLTAETDDACVLVSLKESQEDLGGAGNYILTNSCEMSFDSYMPFAADIEGDGNRTTHHIERNNIAKRRLYDDGDWELVGINGTMARDDKNPLDVGAFFLQVRPGDGAPVSIFSHDHGYNDAAFLLGLDEKKENAMQLVFELGDPNDNVLVGDINPAPGAALGMRGDGSNAWYEPDQGVNPPGYDLVRGVMDDESTQYKQRLYVPVTGGDQNATLVSGWHLVTLGAERSIAGLVTDYPAIDAVIVFRGSAGDCSSFSGRNDASSNGVAEKSLDGDVDTTAWFSSDPANETEFGCTAAAFIHNGGDGPIEGFNID